MKYLWIEDFDFGNLSEVTIENWKNTLGIKDEEITEARSFELGLEELRKTGNYDAVLLDVYLPISDKGTSSNDLYEKYYKDHIIEDFYTDYCEKNHTGVLLYLYLREVLNFPKERIAFISGYVGNEKSSTFFELTETFKKLGIELKHTFSKSDLKVNEENHKPKSQYDDDYDEEEPAENNFQKDFVEPIKNDYIQFRRNIMEMANILKETYCDLDKPDMKWAKDNVPPLDKFVHIRYHKTEKVGNKVIGVKTFFNTQKPDKAIGIGTENYSAEYFYSLLEKTLELPLVPNTDEERTLLNYMRELLFCADCFNIPPKSEDQKNPIFDLAAANVLIKARHGLSHGSATLNSEYTDGLIELKSFLVPLFFRIVFNIHMIPNENREKYLKLERKLLEENGKLDNVKNEVIFETTQNKVLELFRQLCYGVIHPGKGEKTKNERNVFTGDVDVSLKTENNKQSFGQFFLTRLLPEKREMQTSGRKAEYVIKVTLTDNLKDISDDSMEALYIQKAYQVGFGSESK